MKYTVHGAVGWMQCKCKVFIKIQSLMYSGLLCWTTIGHLSPGPKHADIFGGTKCLKIVAVSNK